ncbi:MAG: SDR family oxidoreductase [Candidatus Woesearchaeota archaeon]
MKNALIIGGTKGFGRVFTREVEQQGFNTATIGRSSESTFQGDVTDARGFHNLLQHIKQEMPSIDLLACLVGYARAKKQEELTTKDWERTMQSNVGYVIQTLQELHENIDSNGRIITIGSKWGLRNDCPLFLPYSTAKRKLIEEVRIRGNHQNITCYCVPSMRTPGFCEVRASFNALGMPNIPHENHGDVGVIVENILTHNNKSASPGSIYLMNPDGSMKKV